MADHIRIGDVAPRVHYAADGAQSIFVYPFPIFEADNLEVRLDGLVQSEGFTITGAGDSEGGTVVFHKAPVSGRQVVLRRRMVIERVSDFQPNGVLRARVLNDEMDRQVASLQEVREDLSNAIRIDPGDSPADLVLPLRDGRANRLLGFDSLGAITAVPRDPVLLAPFGGAIPRTVEDKLGERLSARDFGATGNGITDDGPALQAAMNAAAASAKYLDIGEGVHRTTIPLVLPGAAAGLSMRGSILYAGPAGIAALTIGDGAAMRNQAKHYSGLRVLRATISDWLDERDIGIVLRNLDACQVEIRQVEGFTIGIRTLGVELGFEDSTINLGRIVNNRIGLDVRTETAAAWNNSIRYIGGHFANASSVHPTMSRFGVRFSSAPGAYDRHNAHVFHGPGFELQRQGNPGTVEAIPFLFEVGDARTIAGHDLRMEGCSRYVAKVTGQVSDCFFSVGYTGTYGWVGNDVLYGPGVARNGVVVQPRHLALGAVTATRLFASAANVRARAYRDTTVSVTGAGLTGAIGFDEMAVLAGSPSTAPTTLSNAAFAGLTLIDGTNTLLTGDAVGLNTSRALGFVVNTRDCKEIVVAADGSKLRLVVMQFDAAENLLGQSAPVTLSAANMLWNPGRNAAEQVVEGLGSSYWWEMNVNLDQALNINYAGSVVDVVEGVNQLQRIRLHASCAYAIIGVRGGEAGALLRSLRLYCDPTRSPALIYGGGRSWGQRERTAVVPVAMQGLAAGARISIPVSLPRARGGDAATVGIYPDNNETGFISQLRLAAICTGSDAATVWIENLSAATVSIPASKLYVTCTKPRL
ncbi:phage tail fiber protein [Pseudoroseomonas globiformis]|uniref:Phage tail fiber protein n=1 Tax=Teichococcus globiformis TaxID=2307229 RepID=A0ABV7G295_9PROT